MANRIPTIPITTSISIKVTPAQALFIAISLRCLSAKMSETGTANGSDVDQKSFCLNDQQKSQRSVPTNVWHNRAAAIGAPLKKSPVAAPRSLHDSTMSRFAIDLQVEPMAVEIQSHVQDRFPQAVFAFSLEVRPFRLPLHVTSTQ